MKCTRLRQQFWQFLIDLRSGSFWYTEMTGFKELIKRLYIRETCTQCFFLFYNTQNVSKACLLCAHCVLTSIGGVRQLDPRNYRTGRSTEQIWWNLQQGCPKKVHTKTNQRNPQKTTQIKKSICLFAIWPVNSHSHSHQ